MSLEAHGVIWGKRIDLESETGLPSGSAVVASVRPRCLTIEERRRRVDELCGAWADDASLPPIFAEIERRRAMTMPRDADFDATP